MSVLLPEGVHSLADAPHPIHDSILAALHFLKFEELPKDEQPPKRIWFDKEAMEEWVFMVEQKRKRKYEGKGDDGDPGDADENDVDLLVG